MKSLKSVAVLLAFLTVVFCSLEKNTMEVNKVGVATNTNSESTIASAYSIASTKNDPYYENNKGNFASPKYVKKLPIRKQMRGPIESVDEVS